MSENLIDDARELLERWAEWADRHVHPDHSTPPLSGYGPGYRHWGVQSNWGYLAALRPSLAPHVTGDRTCGDGGRRGNSWISMLGIERAMHEVR